MSQLEFCRMIDSSPRLLSVTAVCFVLKFLVPAAVCRCAVLGAAWLAAFAAGDDVTCWRAFREDCLMSVCRCGLHFERRVLLRSPLFLDDAACERQRRRRPGVVRRGDSLQRRRGRRKKIVGNSQRREIELGYGNGGQCSWNFRVYNPRTACPVFFSCHKFCMRWDSVCFLRLMLASFPLQDKPTHISGERREDDARRRVENGEWMFREGGGSCNTNRRAGHWSGSMLAVSLIHCGDLTAGTDRYSLWNTCTRTTVNRRWEHFSVRFWFDVADDWLRITPLHSRANPVRPACRYFTCKFITSRWRLGLF